MADKIRVELDDASGPGFDSITQGANKAEDAVSGMASTMRSASSESDQLRDDLDDAADALANAEHHAAELQDELNDVAGAARKAGRDIDHLGDEAKQTGQQLHDAGEKSKGLGGAESLARLVKFGAALAAARAAVQGIISTVKAMDGEGSPAFQNLTKEAEGIYSALVDIGNDPAVQGWVTSMADGIKNNLIPALSSVPKNIRSMHDDAANFFAYWGEQIGVFEEGSHEAHVEMQMDIDKTRKKNEEVLVTQREQINVTDKIADQERKIASEREQANIKNLTDERTLKILLEEETDALKEMERTGSKDRKAKEEGLKRIETIQRTLAELPGKISEAQIKAGEESSKARADAEQEFQATVKAATEEANRVRDESIKKTIDLAESKRQELLKAIENAKGPGGGNAIQEAKAGIGKDKVLKQIQQSRGDKTEQELRDKLTGEGKLDQHGKAIDEDPQERARKQRQIDEQIRRARQQAGVGAFKDAKSNKIGAGEVDQAQTDLLKAQIKGNEGSMGIANTTSQLATEALNNANATQNALAEHGKTIDEIRGQLAAATAGINGNNNRFKTQRTRG